MKPPRKPGSGGARPGAGRKPAGKVGYTIRVRRATLAAMKEDAAKLDCTVSDLVEATFGAAQ